MASASLSSPVLKQWLELREGRGTEAAYEGLVNSEEAEESAELWDEAQQVFVNAAIKIVDDLVGWVSSAR
jgi:hypothetical protein